MQHDKIRMQHYMEGTIRLLRELILEEVISKAYIVNHLNYLIQMACFAQTKKWQDVLKYDAIYCWEKQQNGFMCGKTSSCLTSIQRPIPLIDDLQPATQGRREPNKKGAQSSINHKTGNPV